MGELKKDTSFDSRVVTLEEFEVLKETLPALHHACKEGRVIFDA